MPVTARVSIVGAGPGDPGLLTRRAVVRLRAADLVLFDALVDARVVAMARRARRFFVGKRAGRHALAQHEINTVMIRAAQRGRRVVRLKGGDPFVFGRGGEEALALQAAGVPFEVIPGVSSLLAGPALAGIPVTHRGLAGAVLVTTGHDAEAFRAQIGPLAPIGLTLVVAMGYARRAAIASILRAAGWSPETPAAIVAAASWPGEAVWRGRLQDLERGEGALTDDVPALLVFGQVAALDLRPDAGTAAAGSADGVDAAFPALDAASLDARRGER